ncbi:MAG: glycerophosphodiester phosphodiesterase family protein [Halofilum sp. (in: g-proteobacteria)]|nr:glycerophosphodiester phosphodiesterase family protein [Halofilum sp. (in: g-proteobacteria)]
MIAARVIAHRGASTLAPENTLAALEKAAGLGARWVEVDAQILADGTVIVFHDDTLERCTDGRGAVAAATWAQVRRLDAGAGFTPRPAPVGVPRLVDVLGLCRERGLGLNLELKAGRGERRGALVDGVLAALAEIPPARDRLLLSSFDASALQLVRERREDLLLGLVCERVPSDPRAATAAFGGVSLHPEWSRLDRAAVGRVRAAGLELYAYTPNEPRAVERLWGWGVDGVITDRPAEMLALPGAGRHGSVTE